MASFLEVATTIPFDEHLARNYTLSVQFPAFLISVVYIVLIFSIQKVMKDRKPFQLTGVLNMWNAWLAIFSTIGALVCGYGVMREIYYRGFVSSYTDCGDYFIGASGYFAWIFVMSKVAEFGDTIFLVLRKKPLIFLHWYHHALTMNYAFLTYPMPNAFNFWITWMNFIVHSVMYGYFMLRSFGVRVPAWVAQNITSLQILQFVITHFILFHIGYLQFVVGQKVDSVPWAYWFCLSMEISYVYLFGQFFYVSYVKSGGMKYQAELKQKSQ